MDDAPAPGSGDPAPRPDDALRRRADAARGQVAPFVRRRFGLLGALRLHTAALGLDLLRAPVNVMLAPFDLLRRLLSLLTPLVGLRRLGRWLAARPLGLRTAVARRADALVVEEILAPLAEGCPEREARLARWVPGALAEYGASRTAAAEITVLSVVVTASLLMFGVLSLGVVSLAPEVAQRMAHGAAVADFPLGGGLGALWYGVVPVEASFGETLVVGVSMALMASVAATFAGVVADPIQAALGLHGRRLRRLVSSLEAELSGEPRPYGARSPYLARVADIGDATAAVLRYLRP